MIYVDVSAAVHSRAGLGRYSEQVAGHVAQLRDDVGLFFNQGRDGKRPLTLSHLPARHINWGYKPWRMAVWMAQLGGVPLNRLVPDATLFHSTEHLLMPLQGVPTVLTVHDLIFELFPQYHKKLNYWFLTNAMPLFCQKAGAIIAISQASKRDLIRKYDIDPAKIHVVYEAAAPHFRPPEPAQIEAVRQAYHLPEQYLVHLSTIEPRKNLNTLLDALQLARQAHPHLQLVLLGGHGWLNAPFFAKLEQDGLTDVVHLPGWVPDEDLPALIAGAEFAIQPSLYEGFGLPILEHMACGQAVACSRASSFPEVGGETAVYFDPTSPHDIARTICHLLENPDELVQRRREGPAQAGQFSWQRTAQETLAVYETLL